MNPALKWEVFYPHPPERVWRAISDPAALEEWLRPEDDVVDYHVIATVAESSITYAWTTRDRDAPDARYAEVTFELQPLSGGTNLRVRMAERNPVVHLALEWLRQFLDRAVHDTAGHVLVFSKR